MGFNSLKQTNQKLAQNPDLSKHNKEVLDDFFRKIRSGGAGDAIIQDYASRFNKLAEETEFKLDEPSQKELEELVAKFNRDEIRKNNGGEYSDNSKDKFWSTLSKFYRWFIKKKGKGYNADIDGPELLEDLEIKSDISTDVDPDKKPTPKEVRKVAKNANTLRDKALILFGWASGARGGEVFITQYNDVPLRWKDLEFSGDTLWVSLVDGKTGEREVPVKVSMPIMKELWKSIDAEKDDPVFVKQNRTYCCPKCNENVDLASSNTNKEYKKYSCPDCGWKGPYNQVKKNYQPLTDDAVRRIVERCVESAGLSGEFDDNPHDFFRKSRAIYKARIGYTEHQMRGFFGWSETSDAPKHYLTLAKEDLEKALAEEFGEEVEYESGFEEEALRPIECVSCGTINSTTADICRECGGALTDQGEELSKEANYQDFEESLLDVLRKEDPAEEKDDIEEVLDMSVFELVKKLQS